MDLATTVPPAKYAEPQLGYNQDEQVHEWERKVDRGRLQTFTEELAVAPYKYAADGIVGRVLKDDSVQYIFMPSKMMSTLFQSFSNRLKTFRKHCTFEQSIEKDIKLEHGIRLWSNRLIYIIFWPDKKLQGNAIKSGRSIKSCK